MHLIKFIALCTIATSVSSIIITFIPLYGYSHERSAIILGQELHRRRHKVNLLQKIGNSKARWSITWQDIIIHQVKGNDNVDKFVKGYQQSIFQSNLFHFNVSSRYCEEILNDSVAMEVLEKSDLIIGEITLSCFPFIPT